MLTVVYLIEMILKVCVNLLIVSLVFLCTLYSQAWNIVCKIKLKFYAVYFMMQIIGQ